MHSLTNVFIRLIGFQADTIHTLNPSRSSVHVSLREFLDSSTHIEPQIKKRSRGCVCRHIVPGRKVILLLQENTGTCLCLCHFSVTLHPLLKLAGDKLGQRRRQLFIMLFCDRGTARVWTRGVCKTEIVSPQTCMVPVL